MATHQIEKQGLILETGKIEQEEAVVWYKRLEEMYYSKFIPALEDQLSSLSPNDERIVLEKVDVELNFDRLADIDIYLREALERSMKKAKARQNKQDKDPDELRLFSSLIYYLNTGKLHWSAGDSEAWQENLVHEARSWSENEWSQVLESIEENGNQVLRRLRDFPVSFALPISDLCRI